MLRKTLLWIFICLAHCTTSYGQSDFITYNWLIQKAKESSYTDHIPHWRRLFNTVKIRGFLECGCGFSTAYFLDNCMKVISIEYTTPGYGLKWYYECLTLFADRKNWIPLTYNEDFRSNSFNNACAYQCSMHMDYAIKDPMYLKELDQHFKAQIQSARLNGYDIDVAFVDPGIYIRGDMVKLLLANKVPIVAAHDTASDNGTNEKKNLYGWNKVATPSNYTKIYIPWGQGTTFWISDKLPEVIESMTRYQKDIINMQSIGLSVSYEDLTLFADTP